MYSANTGPVLPKLYPVITVLSWATMYWARIGTVLAKLYALIPRFTVGSWPNITGPVLGQYWPTIHKTENETAAAIFLRGSSNQRFKLSDDFSHSGLLAVRILFISWWSYVLDFTEYVMLYLGLVYLAQQREPPPHSHTDTPAHGSPQLKSSKWSLVRLGKNNHN